MMSPPRLGQFLLACGFHVTLPPINMEHDVREMVPKTKENGPRQDPNDRFRIGVLLEEIDGPGR